MKTGHLALSICLAVVGCSPPAPNGSMTGGGSNAAGGGSTGTGGGGTSATGGGGTSATGGGGTSATGGGGTSATGGGGTSASGGGTSATGGGGTSATGGGGTSASGGGGSSATGGGGTSATGGGGTSAMGGGTGSTVTVTEDAIGTHTGGGYRAAVTYSSSGDPHIVYEDGDHMLRHTWRSGTSWSEDFIDSQDALPLRFAPQVATDSMDQVHCLYWLGQDLVGPFELHYALRTSQGWTVTDLTSQFAPWSQIAMAVMPSGVPVFAYFQNPSQDLVTQVGLGSQPLIQMVASGIFPYSGDHLVARTNAAGAIWIATDDIQNHVTLFEPAGNGSWNEYMTDLQFLTFGTGFLQTSPLGVESDGTVHLLALDPTGGVVHFYGQGAFWSSQVALAASGGTWSPGSLGDGRPFVVLQSQSDAQATLFDGTGWDAGVPINFAETQPQAAAVEPNGKVVLFGQNQSGLVYSELSPQQITHHWLGAYESPARGVGRSRSRRHRARRAHGRHCAIGLR